MNFPKISVNRQMLSSFEDAIQKEWIVTNGLGGYASSTVLGINTRKYHGLLVAALHPPGDRRVCLAKLDEEVSIGNNVYPLGANEFQHGVFPQGHGFLEEFIVAPFPKHVYAVDDVEVQKTVFMPYEKNVGIVLYTVLNKTDFDIRIRAFPLINWRHFHSVTNRWKISAEPVQAHKDNGVCLGFVDPKSTLVLQAIGGTYFSGGRWLEKLHYREEAKRGESHLDDCFQSGYFEFDAEPNKTESFAFTAAADEDKETAERIMAKMPATLYDMAGLYERELARREDLVARFYGNHSGLPPSDWLSMLVLATDAFIAKAMDDEQSRSVIAGYHWFEAWGRDTFISLPGLMLTTGRFDDARKTFSVFKKYCKEGLIPNLVPDSNSLPAYNSVDATLWYLNAILQYLKYTGDFRFVQEQLWDILKGVIDHHVTGAAFNIHVDGDGLLSHDGQLTWMDATVEGQPVTPRAGKAVEVQALWYNALRIMMLLANKFKESGEAVKYGQMAEKAQKSFVNRFWNVEKNCLFDVVNDTGQDGSLRPNQIIAVAMDFTMLDNAKSEMVVNVVQQELLTPYGLRTLAKNDSRSVGVYAGDRRSRDKAYHNGTVWPWLLGPFITAFMKTKSPNQFRRDYALENFLMPLFSKHVLDAGLEVISEIFDGDAPYQPRGCIAQAWSVAEPLRAYIEDIMQIRPRHERAVLQGLR